MSDPAADDRAFKARTRAMWATGDFPRVARETIKDVGPTLVAAAGVRSGRRVLDVAAGSGATSIPAALAGGDVVASDLTPELLAVGEAAAREQGVSLGWCDAGVSWCGAISAPRREVVAGELLRVVRPGGTIAMANWPPDGWVGQFFLTMLPFMPPPPPGSTPPLAWGV